MKKTQSLFYSVVFFVVAQLAWFFLLSLWIYWYVTNHLLLNRVDEKMAPPIISGGINILALVSGIVLLLVLSLVLTLFFIHLYRQTNITRLYDNFIASVTHELKSPLSSIQLYLETLQRHPLPEEKRREFLSLMLQDVQRLNHLISSILYLSSFEQKKSVRKVTYDYQVYDANTIIREVFTEALKEFNLPRENVSVTGELRCRCVIDRNWLKIVFRNLIDNAIKYSVEPTRIRVTLTEDTRYLHIAVADSGIGIPSSQQKKVFAKFHRIDNPEVPNVKGTGLGLYWVKEIIEYHGGKISVTSAGKNQGSTFHISLPIYKASKKRYTERLLEWSRKRKAQVEHDR